MSSNSSSPPDDYFNDLSRTNGTNGNKRQRPNDDESDSRNGNGVSESANANGDTNQIPKPKRIACIICRKRKLKCDGIKPSCSTCTRLSHNCSYDEVRRKSGPKRGYVKALEERLKQVETLLNSKEPSSNAPTTASTFAPPITSGPSVEFDVSTPAVSLAIDRDSDRWRYVPNSPQPAMEDMAFEANLAGMTMGMDDTTFSWEMIGLGLEEPLPKQEIIDDLHQIYFEKIHPSLPMIHKYRYLAAMNLAPTMRPPVSLRYAMWTLAASITDKYMDLRDIFYQRSRKYVEMDEMKGHGEHMITIAQSQTHTLLASYEFKMMYFPRAWMSTGKAIRLAQMMGLHRLDGVGLDVKQCLPAARDWTETEERRRTFWMAFCEDRYASIGTGWPMTIDEKDVLTNLPSSDEAYEMSKPEESLSLPDALLPSGASKLSAFGSVILMACLFGRNLIHLHRPDPDDRDDDLNGEFWKRHRNMDNILLNTSLSLPNHLKLPNGLGSSNVVFTNMNIHTSTICLHQAAIFKADKNRLPATVSTESKVRCITAAGEIASIMRMISHMDLSAMNPFISFCLYVAARVFVQYLKTHPESGQADDSLHFLLSAMNALKKKNPLTESFLVQLDVDLEGLGMRNPKYRKSINAENPGQSNSAYVEAFMSKNPTADQTGCGRGLVTTPPTGTGTTIRNTTHKVPDFQVLNWLPTEDHNINSPPSHTSHNSHTSSRNQNQNIYENVNNANINPNNGSGVGNTTSFSLSDIDHDMSVQMDMPVGGGQQQQQQGNNRLGTVSAGGGVGGVGGGPNSHTHTHTGVSHSRGGGGGYGNNSDSGGEMDMSLSPISASNSNRPTPNSTAPSISETTTGGRTTTYSSNNPNVTSGAGPNGNNLTQSVIGRTGPGSSHSSRSQISSSHREIDSLGGSGSGSYETSPNLPHRNLQQHHTNQHHTNHQHHNHNHTSQQQHGGVHNTNNTTTANNSAAMTMSVSAISASAINTTSATAFSYNGSTSSINDFAHMGYGMGAHDVNVVGGGDFIVPRWEGVGGSGLTPGSTGDVDVNDHMFGQGSLMVGGMDLGGWGVGGDVDR